MTDHSLFDYIARDDDAPRVASRKALALANKRVGERFDSFLSASRGDTLARLEMIRDDFDAVVAAACEEVGHAEVGSLTRTLWNDRISRISGENPFAKKDSDDDDDKDDKKGEKKKCDCKGDEECSKCKKDDKDDKGNPFAKKDSSRTASTHEARKPRLCPYHNEVMGISLAQGEPAAGYNAMASHAWTGKHCQGDEYDGGKCNFKPEMTTQSYWDSKAEKAEERKQQRAEQQTQIDTQPQTDFESEGAPAIEEPIDNVTEVDFAGSEGGEAEVEAGLPAEDLMSVAASTKRFVPLVRKSDDNYIPGDWDQPHNEDWDHHTIPCPGCGGENPTLLGTLGTRDHYRCRDCGITFDDPGLPEERDDEYGVGGYDHVGARIAEALEHQDVTKNTMPEFTTEHSHDSPATPPKTEGEGSPHPTERIDIQPDITEARPKVDNEGKLEDIGEQVTEHQDVTQKSEFSNKYPNRWASTDDAIAQFNGR